MLILVYIPGCAAVAVYEQCWKKHGRWASDLSEDSHVKDSVENTRSVSQNMEI